MISGTSLSALRTLIHLGQRKPVTLSRRRIAEELGESPTYLSKVTTQLARAGILLVEKGAKGGVRLARPPAEISMLEVIEACQGNIVGAYCKSDCPVSDVCAFHEAAQQLESAICDTLRHWTLEKLLRKPHQPQRLADGFACVMLPPIQTLSGAAGEGP
jgi:Rrf2 family protein